VALAASRAFAVFVTPEIISEYYDVFSRKKLAPLRERSTGMLASLERCWTILRPAVRMDSALDEDDNRFLECASAAGADYLVTGNLRHYPEHSGLTRIVNARRFLSDCFPD